MKKFLFIMLAAFLAQSAQSAVIKKRDLDQNCTLYKAVTPDENGKLKLKSGEVIINQKDAYGLTFNDMEINFDTREVLVQPMINVVMGFNRPLVNGKAVISSENPDFNFLINQLNRKILVFEQMCITDKNVIVYAKMFENTDEQKQK
jgi:hypothetical protein